MVLVRALKTQVTEAVEAIEALKTVPEVDDPLVPVTAEDEAEDGLEKRKGRTGKAPKPKNKPVVTGDDNPLIFSFYSRIVNPFFHLLLLTDTFLLLLPLPLPPRYTLRSCGPSPFSPRRQPRSHPYQSLHVDTGDVATITSRTNSSWSSHQIDV